MMKTIWTLLGTLMAASLFAQDNTNNLPAIPPPVSSPAAETAPAAPAPETAPATKPAKRPAKHLKKHKAVRREHTSKTYATKEATVTLSPGPAEVSANELVVRGQAGLKGEEVAHLSKGTPVTVLEQINLAHHAAGEPSQWAKISYPTNGHVWVSSKYISNGTVSTKKLNLRAGPGENYSVVGVVDEGTPVNVMETKGSWTEIEPPANAYAFVAAKYLTQQAAPPMVASAPETPETPPTPTTVQPPETVMSAPPPPPPPVAPPTPTVRIVSHEGVVGPVGSVIAPTPYKLYDPNTKADIDFLYPTSPDQDLSKLVDDQVIVTGEEGVDARWPNTPVIAIQSIQVVGKNVIKRLDLTPPRQRH